MATYEVIEVYCIACNERIEKPADCIMESFRLGIPLHTKCGQIVDRFLAAWKSAFGVEYTGAGDDLESIEDEEEASIAGT